MNRAELIDEIAQRMDGTRKDAEAALDAVVDVIQRAITEGDKVRVKGLGVFEEVQRQARQVRNPATGDIIEKAASRVPKFRPSTDLKEIADGIRDLPSLIPGVGSDDKAPPRKPAAKAPAPAKAPAAAKAASAPAKKAPAEKAPAKKAPAKKTAAKKAPAKKAPAKKAPAKKTAAKKAPAKKTAAKKAPAKKAPAASTAATTAPAAKKATSESTPATGD